MRNIDWAAAYTDVQEQRRMTGAQRREAQAATRADAKADSRTGIQRASDIITRRSKEEGDAQREAGRRTQQAKTEALRSNAVKSVTQDIPNAAAQAVSGAARNVERARQGQPTKNEIKKPDPKATAGVESAAEREARRAKVGLSGNAGPERAAASQAAAQPKIDKVNADRAAGKTSSLPSDYKKTETKAFNDADKFRSGAGTSSLPRSVQSSMNAPAPKPKPTLNTPKFDTSKVGSGTSNFSAPKPTPAPAPRPSGSGMKRRPTGRSEMRSANIAKTQNRPRPSAPKPIPSSSRLDAATSGIKPMADQFEFKALSDAYDKMYQLDEIAGVVGGLGAALGAATPIGATAGAGAAGAIKGKDTKDKVKKAIAQGTGAAVGGALGGPIGAVIGGGVGDAVSEEAEIAYEAWMQEQITAGKAYNSSGLDLRSPGQKMDHIKKSVQQNDKIQGKIQPPPGV